MMPFAGGPAGDLNATLLFSVVAAIVYLLMVRRPPSWRRTVAKTLSTALLALLAHMAGGPVLLVVALALSALGDAFLAHDGDTAFLGGLGSFLGGHIAYVGLFAIAGYGAGLFSSVPWRWAVAAAIIVFALWMLRQLMPAVDKPLRPPVTIYIIAIVAMGIAALTLESRTVIAGAILFMASDSILATEKFLLGESSPHPDWTPLAVWGLYYTAQVLITLGFLLPG